MCSEAVPDPNIGGEVTVTQVWAESSPNERSTRWAKVTPTREATARCGSTFPSSTTLRRRVAICSALSLRSMPHQVVHRWITLGRRRPGRQPDCLHPSQRSVR